MNDPEGQGGVVRDWSGYVVSVGEATLLVSIADDPGVDHAEIPLDLLPATEREIAAEGLYFRWILTSDAEGNVATRSFAFDRSRWSQADIEDAHARAGELLEGLAFEERQARG